MAMRFQLMTGLLGLLALGGSYAQEYVPEPPTLPKKVRSGVVMEPDPSIITGNRKAPQALESEPLPDDNPPMPITGEEGLEPDITIIRKDQKVIHEYRRGGQLYMVKIIPERGFPYYLIDTDGDGTLDARGSDLERNLNIHQWKVLEWQ